MNAPVPILARFDESGRFLFIQLLTDSEREENRLRPVAERLLARLLEMDFRPVGEA